jgi:methylase of polypeptide subunit release factors
LQQILYACLLNLAEPVQKPIILVGDHFEKLCDLPALLELHGTSGDEVSLRKARNVAEATQFVENHFAELARQGYHSPVHYPALNPDVILKHILRDTIGYDVLFEGIEMTVFPGVFPSHRFRASRALGAQARRLSSGRRILDVGCGPGAVGLVALANGARAATFTDLSPEAIKNTVHNVEQHRFTARAEIHKSDLFDKLPLEDKFDLIYFNPPFHMEARREEAASIALFGGEMHEVMTRFLTGAKRHLAQFGYILMCLSNKDLRSLGAFETVVQQQGYQSDLMVHRDVNTGADVRIYKLSEKRFDQEPEVARRDSTREQSSSTYGALADEP